MLVTLFVKHPFAVIFGAAVVVDLIVGTILISNCTEGSLFPKGVKFGFYKTDEVKG